MPMLPRIPWLSWLIFALSILGAIVLAWNVDPHTRAGVARIIGSGIAVIVAMLTLVGGTRTARRIAAIEAGRYPRPHSGASSRIAERIRGEIPQTVMIAAEGGDDIREVVAVLVDALRSANWHIRGEPQYGTLWSGGRGIMVHHAATATEAATALIDALGKEGLPVKDAGDSPSGLPVHIAFRRP